MLLNNTEIILFALQPSASRPAGAQAAAQQWPFIGAPSINKTPTVKLYILINTVIRLLCIQSPTVTVNVIFCHILVDCTEKELTFKLN